MQGVIANLKSHGAEQQFILQLPPDLPTVKADPIRVETIISNLLMNATRYSRAESEIKISGHTDRNHVIVDIADQGVGISPDDQNKLFVPVREIKRGNISDQGTWYRTSCVSAVGGSSRRVDQG